MSLRSIVEYAEAIRARYRLASKVQKGMILDEFCSTTGYNRKSAIRLLGKRKVKANGKRGRPRKYSVRVGEALKAVWEASDYLCSKRLSPFLAELVGLLEKSGTLKLESWLKEELLQLSASTIDRMLRPYRYKNLRQPYVSSRSCSSLRAQIPVRTFGEWEGADPGEMQADLVLHCGESTEGFYLSTLDVVDVASGWTECRVVWGKGQSRVRGRLDHIRRQLPFPLKGLHTDNGSEFLNGVIYPYCRGNGIALTRGRPYKKNDQAYVEQKNWSVVRSSVGYDRYSNRSAYKELERLYGLLWWQVNFLKPVRKLVGKKRVGGKLKKTYDTARTPYQRLIEAGILSQESVKRLGRAYDTLDPVKLKREIEQSLQRLWKLREQPRSSYPAEPSRQLA